MTPRGRAEKQLSGALMDRRESDVVTRNCARRLRSHAKARATHARRRIGQAEIAAGLAQVDNDPHPAELRVDTSCGCLECVQYAARVGW